MTSILVHVVQASTAGGEPKDRFFHEKDSVNEKILINVHEVSYRSSKTCLEP